MNESTAKRISIPIAACISTLFLWFLCLASPPKLVGHWHIYKADGARPLDIEFIQTIDFLPRVEARLNADPIGNHGIAGEIVRRERKMYFGGECIYFQFRYRLKQDTLFLQQINSHELDNFFYALRCQEGCCDKQRDFFNLDPVDIDLPVTEHPSALDTLPNLSTWMYIKIGQPKQEYKTSSGTQPKLLLGSKFSTIEDLDFWREKHLVKLPKGRRSKARPLLFIDRSTDLDQLSPILHKLAEMGYPTTYFVLRSADTYPELKLWVQAIHIEHFTCSTVLHGTIEDLLQRTLTPE